ncbi:hypothetical protein Tco_0024141 [Tanacetum coccineum]
MVPFSGFPPYPIQNYPTRRLTIEDNVGLNSLMQGKHEHEEMEIFIKEFRTTNELLLKTRSNLLSELKIKVNELSKVVSNVLIPKNQVKGVTTRGGKITSETTRSKESNEIGINKNEPPRFEQDVPENLHDDGEENKSSMQIPKYDKYLKSLLTNKSRLEEACTEIMNERCSAVLLNKLPLKEKDPRSFTIPCQVLEKHKEAKILAANHLFENPHMEVLAEREIADKFSDEHLMVLKSKFNNDEPWYVDFVNYIIGKVVPQNWTFKKRKRFFSQVKTYFWEEPYAFKLCADNIMRRCMAGRETLEILVHCHSGPIGGHHSASVTAKKICEVFDVWGLDFMRPFPESRGPSERNDDIGGIIMEYVVKISKKTRILELKRDKRPLPDFEEYAIRRICACTSPDHDGLKTNTPYQGSSIRRIQGERMEDPNITMEEIVHNLSRGLRRYSGGRRLFEIRAPLVREFILEFFSTCKIGSEMGIDVADTLCFQLGGARRRSERAIPDKGDLSDYWVKISSDRGFLRGAPSYTYMRDPIWRLCHRLISYSISRRGRAPKKVTATNLFYLWSTDRGAANVLYLLAWYLFRHAGGRKSSSRLSGGHFIGRLAHHFGLVNDEGLRGLSVVTRELPLIDIGELVKLNICIGLGDDWAWVVPGLERQQVSAAGAPEATEGAPHVDKGDQTVPAPIHAPPPPPPAAVRTIPERLGRLEEEMQELRQDVRSLRGLVERSMTDQGRFSTWMISCMTQLMEASRQTYQAFDGTFRGSSPAVFERRTRKRIGFASTSAAPQQLNP